MSKPRKSYTISLSIEDADRLEALAEKMKISPTTLVRTATLEAIQKP